MATPSSNEIASIAHLLSGTGPRNGHRRLGQYSLYIRRSVRFFNNERRSWCDLAAIEADAPGTGECYQLLKTLLELAHQAGSMVCSLRTFSTNVLPTGCCDTMQSKFQVVIHLVFGSRI